MENNRNYKLLAPDPPGGGGAVERLPSISVNAPREGSGRPDPRGNQGGGGGGGGNAWGRPSASRNPPAPGVKTVSQQTITDVQLEKDKNSTAGYTLTSAQAAAIVHGLNDLKGAADRQGRRADSRYIQGEINKMQHYIASLTPRPPAPSPAPRVGGNDGSRNDGTAGAGGGGR